MYHLVTCFLCLHSLYKIISYCENFRVYILLYKCSQQSYIGEGCRQDKYNNYNTFYLNVAVFAVFCVHTDDWLSTIHCLLKLHAHRLYLVLLSVFADVFALHLSAFCHTKCYSLLFVSFCWPCDNRFHLCERPSSLPLSLTTVELVSHNVFQSRKWHSGRLAIDRQVTTPLASQSSVTLFCIWITLWMMGVLL